MKHLRLILTMGLMLLLAACGAASKPAGDVILAVRAEPEPLAVGETTLVVTLTDSSGRPVDGAHIRVQGSMDHAGMDTVERETRDSVDGEYRMPFAWTMGGGWVVTVTAELPNNGGEISQKFDFFVEAVSGESIIHQAD